MEFPAWSVALLTEQSADRTDDLQYYRMGALSVCYQKMSILNRTDVMTLQTRLTTSLTKVLTNFVQVTQRTVSM
jgi:hypothetical protein